MKNGFNAKLLRKLPQVAFVADREYVERLPKESTIVMNSYEECCRNKKAFGENFVKMEIESNRMEQTKTIVQDVCGLAVDYGDWFGGDDFKGFIRINLATSLDNVMLATSRLLAALTE